RVATQNRTLSFVDRVAYQHAIEEAYSRQRISLKESAGSKPSLDAGMPTGAAHQVKGMTGNPITGDSFTFSPTGSLGTARTEHTGTLLPNGKVLAAGGANSDGYLTSTELYDPAGGSWSITGSLGTARTEHTATLLFNGKVLVAGGSGIGNVDLTSAEVYDP